MLRCHQSTVRALDRVSPSTFSNAWLLFTHAIYKSASSGSKEHVSSRPMTSVTRPVDKSRRRNLLPTAPRLTLLTRLSAHVDSLGADNDRSLTEDHATHPLLEKVSVEARGFVHDPSATLKGFLSPTATKPSKFTAYNLISLYHSVKAHSQLTHLSSKQLTELLALLGTLSLPSPRNPCIYFSKLLPYVAGGTTFQTYWPTVLEIAGDKERLLGRALNGTDRYWIMRAQLAQVVVTDNEPLQPDDPRLRALSKATMQYLRIWRHSPDPEIHVPYFQGLLSARKPFSDLVSRIHKVLELYANPHSQIIDILLRVLLKHSQDITPERKEQLLSMVSNRLSKSNTSYRKGCISVPKVSDTTSNRRKPVALNVSELASALGNAVFPSCFPTVVTPFEVSQWASAQASSTFSPATPQDLQWANFLLLAIYRLLRTSTQGAPPLLYSDVGSVDWQTVFLLAALEWSSSNVNILSQSSKRELRGIIRPLWRTWKGSKIDGKTRPINVTRAIAATFFRLAAEALDMPLAQACYRFSIAGGLFLNGDADSDADKIQATNLLVAYAISIITCEGKPPEEVLPNLEFPRSPWHETLLEPLILHYASRDTDAAYRIFLLGKEYGVKFSGPTVYQMCLALVTSHTWHLSIPLLCHPGFSHRQVEDLVGAILRTLRDGRHEFMDPALVKPLAETMWTLYAHRPPSERFKYPIRFVFQIMIASGQPSGAVSLVEAIHRQAPGFFTIRLLLRLARALVRYRHLHLTNRVLQLVPVSGTRASDDFRRKLTLMLARAGAYIKAHMVYRSGIQRKGWRTTMESISQAVGFRVKKPSILRSLQVVHIVTRNPLHPPTIKYAANVLIRANRAYAARKLLQRSQHHLDDKTRTSIANAILHSFLKQHVLRNGRLVRYILRTKKLLEKNYGFIPDRVTVNIIIKAILRWRQVITAPKVRALFDYMVRCGYPVSLRWRQEGGVPFGTLLSSPVLRFPNLSTIISFERHVRPMYKMFVKALYARQDVRGAKIVIGILKEEEVAAMRSRESRNRARREGLIKKWARERGRKEDGLRDL